MTALVKARRLGYPKRRGQKSVVGHSRFAVTEISDVLGLNPSSASFWPCNLRRASSLTSEFLALYWWWEGHICCNMDARRVLQDPSVFGSPLELCALESLAPVQQSLVLEYPILVSASSPQILVRGANYYALGSTLWLQSVQTLVLELGALISF